MDINGLYLLFLNGKNVFLWIFCKPWYPESTKTCFSGWIKVLDFKNNLKSWMLPKQKAVEIIFPFKISIIICVFKA